MDKSRILCVEDDECVRRLYLLIFRDLAAVDTAEHGRRGLEILAANPAEYALVVTDNNMPVMNGLNFMSQARQYGLPLLMVSSPNGMAGKQLYHSVRAHGGVGLLEKPFNSQQLRTIAKELLEIGGSPTYDAYVQEKGYVKSSLPLEFSL